MSFERKLAMNAQHIAIEACNISKGYLKPGMSEKDFASLCEEVMLDLGANGLWYPMLVNFGTNTVYCTRGKHLPSDKVFLADNDIVLVDFSPLVNGYWGDYSETILVGYDSFFSKLINDAREVFEQTYSRARVSRTIGDLYWFCREMIENRGYKLLDPNGNIGHSIEDGTNLDKRVYIDHTNVNEALTGKRWAIEPHIGKNGFGAKFENVIESLRI